MAADSTNEESSAQNAFTWQQSRRRKDGHFDYPIAGLADGSYTLWVPANRKTEQLKIINGKAQRVVVEAVCDPELEALQNEVLGSLTCDSTRQVVLVDMRFIDLFAALLQRNYTLNDDDLSFLLAGSRWQENAIIYLLGGEHAMMKLAEIAESQVMPAEPEPEFHVPLPPIAPAAPVKRWWQFWR